MTNIPPGSSTRANAAEALRLPRLAEQAEQRVEHQVHQPEPAAGRHLGHVSHGDRDRLAARLGPQPFHHRGRCVNPFHGDPPGRQRQRDPSRPDGQLQHPPVSGQAGHELHRGPRVHLPVVVVINGRPAIAVERGIIEAGHGLKQTQTADATHLPAQAAQPQDALIRRIARVRVVRDVMCSRSGRRSTAGSAPRTALGAQLLLWRQRPRVPGAPVHPGGEIVVGAQVIGADMQPAGH
jgi:hypothetical protein